MRVFIGIKLNEKVKEQLRAVQQEVKDQSSKGRFTRTENFHLTLRFLGEREEKEVEILEEKLAAALKCFPAFSIEADGFQWFSKRSGLIPWIGLKENPALQNLHGQISATLEELGILPEDLPYTPHLTLGRNVRIDAEAESVWEKWREKKVVKFRQPVKEVTLFQSLQVEGVLTYLPLAVFPLGGSKN